MGLLDLLSFKKDASELFSAGNVTSFFAFIREKILTQAELNKVGEAKKAFVDSRVIEFIQNKASSCKNKLVLWLVRQLINVIPRITQIIYDFLKEKIANL